MSWVALLRGINVGGKNKLPMRELVAIFEAAGASEVKTYIQSGNVVFRAPPRTVDKLASTIEKKIFEQHGLKVPLVLREGRELERIAAANPFLAHASDEKALHVMFLADEPKKQLAAALDPARSPPDQFRVVGREIYLYCPNGVARTKLTNDWFDRSLSTVSTSRNWRTVLTLLEMSKE